MDQSLSASGPSAMLFAWYATGFAQFASLALMLYDIVTKMDEEVQHFWKPDYRNATPLYFLTRYTGPVAIALCLCGYFVDVNREAGTSFGWIRSLSGYTGVLLTDIVVLLKVIALYVGNKKLSNILAVIIVVQSGALLGILLFLQIHTNYVTQV
ncbi:uncharacterized protein FOMMEDRAFT_165806, partial [Fomitiporia mediterranea MF3/22]|uniref:uncharacterized protein n=1 Tax=Fomitiporia mediterranea (strain MF3/22) TaxID=694068 RepID=UPI00044090B6